MTTKTCFMALALTLAPALAFAEGCNYGKYDQQAMSCAAGTTYDASTKTCLPTTS
ncbi:hypothetical protein ACERZ8_17800 [Tateyamaria armeniaca]|uniref:Chitin-binding type-2 domain-containing protein n=1 Tax=Tateyamaria armeniaca TaxID=2518930 RepID=A0ABW8UXG8_9RHOB